MKFLIDNPLARSSQNAFGAAGHDAAQVRDYRVQAATDSEVLSRLRSSWRNLRGVQDDLETGVIRRDQARTNARARTANRSPT